MCARSPSKLPRSHHPAVAGMIFEPPHVGCISGRLQRPARWAETGTPQASVDVLHLALALAILLFSQGRQKKEPVWTVE